MKRICACIVDRANLGRLQPVLDAINDHSKFDLLTICGGSFILQRFGMPVADYPYHVSGVVHCSIENNMAMSIGLAEMGFAQHLKRLSPDYVLIIGDRHEAMGCATAAACLRIPIIHFQGGEISGTLDNKWRHAITQLADYHVPATNKAEGNVFLKATSKNILTTGCPSSDLAARLTYDKTATGPLMVSFHPDTASDRDHAKDMAEVLEACDAWPSNVYWPNIDSGSDKISKEIRRMQQDPDNNFKTTINEDPATYLGKLATTTCCVGNSSSFVRDASFFGTPVVLVGDRQKGRECAENVMHVPCESEAIFDAIRKQREHGRYPPSTLYGDGHVTERFIKALESL